MELQRSLPFTALLVEYVLAEPHSYALAITRSSDTPYRLPSKTRVEADADRYRKELHAGKADLDLGQTLFNELLAPIQGVSADAGFHLGTKEQYRLDRSSRRQKPQCCRRSPGNLF